MSRRFGDVKRQYAQTHPWINFTFALKDLSQLDYVRLGEALSKAEHISNVPVPPAAAEELHQIYLVKGIHATTQIEGNTLSEDEVRRRVTGELDLPPSQEYLGKEVDNVLHGCNMIMNQLIAGELQPLDRARIEQFNAIVMEGLTLDHDGVVGRVRTGSVVVGGGIYRGAPAEDCAYLLDELCDWLNTFAEGATAEWAPITLIVRAVIAHLYLAWIHPFDDGNGRTARLVEFQLLAEARFPSPACHLLSNYYNRTRQLYYQVLRDTSRKPPYEPQKFVSYAIRGFVEELREQLRKVSMVQLGAAWTSFVHEVHVGKSDKTVHRRRQLVLALSATEATPIARIAKLTPELAAEYATLTPRAVARDINALLKAGLLTREGARVVPNIGRLLAFLPPRLAD